MRASAMPSARAAAPREKWRGRRSANMLKVCTCSRAACLFTSVCSLAWRAVTCVKTTTVEDLQLLLRHQVGAKGSVGGDTVSAQKTDLVLIDSLDARKQDARSCVPLRPRGPV